MLRRGVSLLLVGAILGGILTVISELASTETASAADSREFDPGYLISDQQFFDGNAMSAAGVQSFLDSKVARCTIGDSGRKAGATYGTTTIAEYCLRDFRATTSTIRGDAYCSTYTGAPSESAAQIIAKVGMACGISQKAILVLLEKEQSLVSDTWPTTLQFRSATGFGCPDTAACDANYYGFFNQVYRAARQFKIYKAIPNAYNHIAGRNNYVRFHPNASCGTSTVFIKNTATAGLYNYTPYQPNRPALNNLYGSGDSCSSYGNRNFWRTYSDWFGSPTGQSSLVRTVSDTTVYVTSNGNKYPITSQAVLAALSPLGPVDYVSESFLAQLQTVHPATQVVRGPDGSIYFAGSGFKLPFSSCDLVAHYGGSCSASGYVQLDETQMMRFVTGPILSRIMGTQEGSRYYLENGSKREILDAQAQAAAGITGGMNVLTESALAAMPFGEPIVRESVVVTQRGSTAVSLIDGNMVRWPVATSEAVSWGFPARSVGRLREESLSKLTQSNGVFNGFVSSQDGTLFGLSSHETKFSWSPPAGEAPGSTPMGAVFLEQFVTSENIGIGSFVKSTDDGTIYLITDTLIRPIGSWETLVSMSDLGNPRYSIVPRSLISSLKPGPIALEAATLVRSPSDATVYLINGLTNKIPVSSFDPVVQAGISRFSFTTQDRIDAYPGATLVMEYGLACAGTKYLAAGGQIHEVSEQLAVDFPFVYMELDKYVCRKLVVGRSATQFIRTPDGSIFQVEDGQKRPIASLSRFQQLDALSAGYMNVTTRFAALIPTGPLA